MKTATANPAVEAPAAAQATASNDPVPGVLATVTAITATTSNPVVTREVTAALQRLTVVQSLATAMQDAVSDLRARTTLELAAVGAATVKMIETGDLKSWQETLSTLQAATRESQRRLDSLIALAQGRSPETPAPTA